MMRFTIIVIVSLGTFEAGYAHEFEGHKEHTRREFCRMSDGLVRDSLIQNLAPQEFGSALEDRFEPHVKDDLVWNSILPLMQGIYRTFRLELVEPDLGERLARRICGNAIGRGYRFE